MVITTPTQKEYNYQKCTQQYDGSESTQLSNNYFIIFSFMSRKISRLASQALMSKTPFRLSNTEVIVTGDTASLYLYGNLIAVHRDTLHVSLA